MAGHMSLCNSEAVGRLSVQLVSRGDGTSGEDHLASLIDVRNFHNLNLKMIFF